MSAHIVFVRFFAGYSDEFPYRRILQLDDLSIPDGIESICKKWVGKPANRTRLKAWRTKQKEIRTQTEQKSREWNGGCVARPGKTQMMNVSEPVYDEPSANSFLPTFFEVASIESWRSTPILDLFSPLGISGRFPVAKFNSRRNANVGADALQARVMELQESARTKDCWSEGDSSVLLAEANPHFFVVPESQLHLSDQTTV